MIYPGETNVITRILLSEREKQQSRSRNVRTEAEIRVMQTWASEMEAASRRQKNRSTNPPTRASRRNTTLLRPDLSSGKFFLDF